MNHGPRKCVMQIQTFFSFFRINRFGSAAENSHHKYYQEEIQCRSSRTLHSFVVPIQQFERQATIFRPHAFLCASQIHDRIERGSESMWRHTITKNKMETFTTLSNGRCRCCVTAPVSFMTTRCMQVSCRILLVLFVFWALNLKRLNKSFMRWHCFALRKTKGSVYECWMCSVYSLLCAEL